MDDDVGIIWYCMEESVVYKVRVFVINKSDGKKVQGPELITHESN